VQGALAIFGTASEDLQKVQTKVQGCIAAMMGLHTVMRTLQKNSAFMLMMSKLKTAFIGVSMGATTATVSVRALWAALRANPLGLILTAATAAVSIIGILINLNDSNRNIAAVICNTLKVGSDIRQIKALLDGTFTLSEPSHMAALHLLVDLIDGLLKRLYLLGECDVLILKRSDGQIHDLFYRIGEYLHLGLCLWRKLSLRLAHAPGLLHDVEGMVTDTLVVSDAVQKN
jgi:hypothetical protein